MKTIPWSKFVESLSDDNLVTKVDGMDNVRITLINSGVNIVSISWVDGENAYTFDFDKKDNEEVPVRENELFLHCNEDDVDIFTFSFFKITKHFFRE